MLIELDAFNSCVNTACTYRKECAQHASAGDYRSEGAFAPQITKDLNCLTADEPPSEREAGVFPANYLSLGYGYCPTPFSHSPDDETFDYPLTKDDIALLQGITVHLYYLHYLLSYPLNGADIASPSKEYGVALESLIDKIFRVRP